VLKVLKQILKDCVNHILNAVKDFFIIHILTNAFHAVKMDAHIAKILQPVKHVMNKTVSICKTLDKIMLLLV
jgi:hypothetical protein